MKNLLRHLALLTVFTAGPVAADEGIPESVICSTAEILECLPTESCERVSAETARIPNFLRVNFTEGTISRKRPGGESLTSPIKRAEELEGRLVLQGAEDATGGERGGVGWTMSIDKQSGQMVLTASGDGVAFVIFGACIAP